MEKSIDLSGYLWTAIGTNDARFQGVFDGQNNTISGMTIENVSSDDQGLFGYVENDVQDNGSSPETILSYAVIKNINLTESTVNALSCSYVGGIVGYCSGNVENCTTTDSVTVTGKSNVGGIVGASYGDITGCENSATVTGKSNVGGVVGETSGDITDSYNKGTISAGEDSNVHSYVGGVVGYNSSGTVKSSYNQGEVNGDGDYVGGVVGCNSNGTVENSYNEASITGVDYVGGVAGNNNGMIETSYNKGSVTGLDRVGGVAGGNNGMVETSYNIGDVTGDKSCYEYVGGVVGHNQGLVSNTYNQGTVNYGGGIVGQNEAGWVEYSYNSGTATDDGAIDGITSASATATQIGLYYDKEINGESKYESNENNENITGLTTEEITGSYDDGRAYYSMPELAAQYQEGLNGIRIWNFLPDDSYTGEQYSPVLTGNEQYFYITFDASEKSETDEPMFRAIAVYEYTYMVVEANSVIGELPIPEDIPEGYYFDGWYTNSDYKIQITAETVVTDDMYACAKYTEKMENSITVTIESWTYGETPSVPVAETTDGDEVTYKYYSDKELTKEIDEVTAVGTYYIVGTVTQTETYLEATSEAVEFEIKQVVTPTPVPTTEPTATAEPTSSPTVEPDTTVEPDITAEPTSAPDEDTTDSPDTGDSGNMIFVISTIFAICGVWFVVKRKTVR